MVTTNGQHFSRRSFVKRVRVRHGLEDVLVVPGDVVVMFNNVTPTFVAEPDRYSMYCADLRM